MLFVSRYAIRPPEYEHVVEALTPVLYDLPGKLVAIDGRDGSGKTTLGRFLAWYFNVSLIETDLFLFDGMGLACRSDEVNRIISARLAKPRPVIVEGVAIMRLLSGLGRTADFLIYVKNQAFGGSERLSEELLDYERSHCPEASVNLVLEISH